MKISGFNLITLSIISLILLSISGCGGSSGGVTDYTDLSVATSTTSPVFSGESSVVVDTGQTECYDNSLEITPQQSHEEPEWMSQITDAQKDELCDLINEITITMLSEWGIEVSEDELPEPFEHPGPPQGENGSSRGNMGGPGGDSRPQGPEWMDELTDDQREELIEEIAGSIQDKLEGWGIEVSEDEIHFGPPPQGGR